MHASVAEHVQASVLQELSHRVIHSIRSIRIAVLIADPARQFARQALSHRVEIRFYEDEGLCFSRALFTVKREKPWKDIKHA